MYLRTYSPNIDLSALTNHKTPIIPLALHEKLVHSLAINLLPSLRYIEYRQRHDTRIRW
jgi:hypothetical protein